MWKAANFKKYPMQMERMTQKPNGRITRGITQNNFIEPATQTTFFGDATRNKAPESIRKAKPISIAKKEIKTHCKTLPI